MIQEEIPRLRKAIEDLKASATNVERFLEIVQKYTDIRELPPEILRTFISKIVIHERNRKHVKDAEQDIDIYFTHIGNLTQFRFDRQIPQMKYSLKSKQQKKTADLKSSVLVREAHLTLNILMRRSVI